MLIGDTFLTIGQRQRAEEAFGEMRALATRTRNIQSEVWSAAMDAVLATMDGRLEEAFHMAENIRTRGREAGVVAISNLFASLADTRARVYPGASLEDLEQELRGLPVQRPEESRRESTW